MRELMGAGHDGEAPVSRTKLFTIVPTTWNTDLAKGRAVVVVGTVSSLEWQRPISPVSRRRNLVARMLGPSLVGPLWAPLFDPEYLLVKLQKIT